MKIQITIRQGNKSITKLFRDENAYMEYLIKNALELALSSMQIVETAYI